jgi:hypothetical protein
VPTSTEQQLLRSWIRYVFAHGVSEPAWHFAADAPIWHGAREQTPILIAQCFEAADSLLMDFSDEQIDQGLWFLIGEWRSEFPIATLIDGSVPHTTRLRALRSFVPLFDQIMSIRCAPLLSHLDEPGLKPLNSICYMWWDLLGDTLFAPDRHNSVLRGEAVAVLGRLLDIPHDACRESALHGLGHWAATEPDLTASLIDEFLLMTDLRPELRRYAEYARLGQVL